MPEPTPLEASLYPTMGPVLKGAEPRAAGVPKAPGETLDALERAMYPSMRPQGADAEHAEAKAAAAKVEDSAGDKGPKPTPGVPDGFTPGPGFDQYQATVKELGLSPDASVRLIETYQAAQDAQREAWAEAAQSDPENRGRGLPARA